MKKEIKREKFTREDKRLWKRCGYSELVEIEGKRILERKGEKERERDRLTV